MSQTVKVRDLTFKPFIKADKIAERVNALAAEISGAYRDQPVLFVCMLSGAFVFASDLLRAMDTTAEICFVKWSSYDGTSSTGTLKQELPLDVDVKGRKVVVVEDIVETGLTLYNFKKDILSRGAAECRIATLLYKPQCLRYNLQIDWKGFEIGNEFVVGYGLDYNGEGRMLRDLYVKA
ncbi:MAG: hypoxanthine phosphoribosyltransferase [Paludibacteraceae bacterium]|nr:hypoxanthine phosphoribosyltransferase [Paludibacteraceae bacterium]